MRYHRPTNLEGFVKIIVRNIVIALVLLAGCAYAYTIYLVHALRQPVLEQLKDPDSAKFRNEKVHGGWTVGSSFLCGEVNAKTPMGGYAGYKKFWALKGKAADLESEILNADYINSQCAD
ncbi:hypothetical protein EDF71_1435 [Comamonas sp. JUb58]|nr:hypothetical protein EDF71_1435 [Comamonas sp. JUb58]